MIKLKINDLLNVREEDSGKDFLAVIERVDINVIRHYITRDNLIFNEDFIDDNHKFEITDVWRYDELTGDFVRIYNKYNEKTCKLIVGFKTYSILQHENEELKNIIVELNKKIYVKNN